MRIKSVKRYALLLLVVSTVMLSNTAISSIDFNATYPPPIDKKFWLKLGTETLQALGYYHYLQPVPSDHEPESLLKQIAYSVALAARGHGVKENFGYARKNLAQLATWNQARGKHDFDMDYKMVKAGYLFSMGELDSATRLYMALESAATLEQAAQAYIHHMLAKILLMQQEPASAVVRVEKADVLYKALGMTRDYRDNLLLKGRIYSRLEYGAQAKKIFNALIDIAKKESDTILEAYATAALAKHYLLNEKADLAIMHLEALRPFFYQHDRVSHYHNVFSIAKAHYHKGEFGLAVEKLNKAKQYFNAIGRIAMVSRCDGNLGVIYQEVGNYEKALELYFSIYNWAIKTEQDTVAGTLLNNIANVYSLMSHYDKAMEYYLQGLELFEKQNHKRRIVDTLNNMGAVQAKMKTMDSAYTYYRRSLSLLSSIDYVTGRVHALRGVALSLISQDKYDSARRYLSEALALLSKTDTTASHFIVHDSMGWMFFKAGHWRQAEHHYLMALQLAEKSAREEHLIKVMEKIALLYSEQKNYYKAYHLLERLTQLKDESRKNTLSNKLATVRVEFELLNKEREIHLLNKENQLKSIQITSQKNQRNIFYLLGAGSLLVLFLILSRYHASRQTNKKLEQLNWKLKEAALHDPLTGVKNRRYLNEYYDMQEYCNTFNLDREENKMALFIIDIDFFKRVNDEAGHHAGDRVLIEFASRLKEQAELYDVIVRWGGEEFLFISPNSNICSAKMLAKNIIESIRNRGFSVDSGEIEITCSIGYCVFSALDTTDRAVYQWEANLKMADQALYRAKERGRNQAIGIDIDDKVPGIAVERLAENAFDPRFSHAVSII